ncbi:oxidoreductase of aldo, keto reductase family, subgroup 1 [Fructilactobacillus florum 8D]|uniref:Oxidoreductase of aldo, keto reductase family, subgroup 1 n=1 Tax=Fructilactobacillus florum 8D TaxID=1221538 RepID=W9EGS3_9LACO|nr:aldo/keto reductase [Fructilactobacillus florum]ETO40215.1 oxidoreductase of aldo, keto reductase family, subgroup 1 [Fructilactobacillus florum 8D]
MEYYQLQNGMQLPKIGFGTYKLTGTNGARAITTAINNGYRLIDSAYNYENEGALGVALQNADIARSQLTITSKLPGRYYHRDQAITAIQESLYRSRLDYFDLYLLHWPNPKRDQYVEAWQALLDAQKFGLVRAVGVCNFLPEHLDRLQQATGVLPQINQIELHPYFNQAPQRAYDEQHQILTQAWSPLGRASVMLQDPVLNQIADKYKVSVAQIILRWDLQLGVLPIPKAIHSSRQLTNLDIFSFTLTPDDMERINQLSKPDGRTHQQDPASYEEF